MIIEHVVKIFTFWLRSYLSSFKIKIIPTKLKKKSKHHFFSVIAH